MFKHLAASHFEKSCVLQTDFFSVTWFHKVLIQGLNLLWIDWYLNITTALLFHPQSLLLSKLSKIIGLFSCWWEKRIPHCITSIHIKSLY